MPIDQSSYGPESAMGPASGSGLDNRDFREGGALRFLRIAIRCTADVIVQIQLRRSEMAAQAEIERLFANDPHFLRDIGGNEHCAIQQCPARAGDEVPPDL
jgi:hypothetical protein